MLQMLQVDRTTATCMRCLHHRPANMTLAYKKILQLHTMMILRCQQFLLDHLQGTL
jgi:hypothetical protein